jgi:putative flippase GtrA
MRAHTALRFGIVGIANTFLDFVVFLLLVRGLSMEPLWANLTAFFMAVTNSFLLNRHWTFAVTIEKDQQLFLIYLRYIAVNSVGLALGTSLIYLLLPWMSVELAKVASVLVTFLWNYFGSRYLVFNKKEIDE